MAGKRRKKDFSKRRQPTGKIVQEVLQLLNTNPGKAYSIKHIIKKLKYRDKGTKNTITDVVISLSKNGKITKLSNGSFQSVKKPSYVVGTVDHVNPKYAYIENSELDDDVWVKTRDLMGAEDGDTVKVVLIGQKHGFRPEGKVVELLRKSRRDLVGRIEVKPNYSFVIPDNRKIYFDIFIPPENIGKAKNNDKVLVELVKNARNDKNPVGRIIDVLGQAGEHEAEMHSIMAEFGLPFKFPGKILREADKISEDIQDSDLKYRRDFREITTFTIDPEDAKDFDDALSFKKLDNGNFEVGIHIADVTHYLKSDTPLDHEAVERATSVYLVDRTIPMLPERLSNNLCSLNPKEDKLTFSAVFELNEQSQVIKEWFGKTIIYSDRRFTYEEAQERIDNGKGDFAEELIQLNQLAIKLRNERFSRGAINFETVEVKFRLGEDGAPLEVIPKQRKDSHKLIEEFMLLANKRVAGFVYKMKSGKKRNTFVYRTHDQPDHEKLTAFSAFVKRFGHEVSLDGTAISQSLNQLMEEIEGKPEQNVLESLAIRAMAKAKYTTEEKGHFGLAFSHYSHFTSPIRRYPDVLAHRLLYHYLNNGPSVNRDEYEDLCEHCSEMEKLAADAERASVKYKQVEFMQNAENKPYKGIVTGVTEWGIFVEIIETKCEGMVRLADMTDDFYEFDENNYCVIGKRNKRMITLGDQVEVEVVRTDIDRRIIDLEFTEAFIHQNGL